MRTLLGYLWEPHCTGGNNTYLSYLDEVFLEDYIRSSISKGRAVDADDVRKIAELLYLGMIASAVNIVDTSNLSVNSKSILTLRLKSKTINFEDRWRRSFLERCELTIGNSEFIEQLRVKYATSGAILKWFQEYSDLIKSFPAEQIYNMDEININFCDYNQIIVKKGMKTFLSKEKPTAMPHITACYCFNGLGKDMSLYLLTKETRLAPEIKQLIDSGLMNIAFSPNGWMLRHYFLVWAKYYIEFVEKQSDSRIPKLLLLDSHNSRENNSMH